MDHRAAVIASKVTMIAISLVGLLVLCVELPRIGVPIAMIAIPIGLWCIVYQQEKRLGGK